MVPAIDRAHAHEAAIIIMYAFFGAWTMLLANTTVSKIHPLADGGAAEQGCGCIPGGEHVDPPSPDHTFRCMHCNATHTPITNEIFSGCRRRMRVAATVARQPQAVQAFQPPVEQHPQFHTRAAVVLFRVFFFFFLSFFLSFLIVNSSELRYKSPMNAN